MDDELAQEVKNRIKKIGMVFVPGFLVVTIFSVRFGSISGVKVPYLYPEPWGSVAVQVFEGVKNHILPPSVELMVFHPTDGLLALFYSIMVVTLGVSMPWILYQIISFISPALYKDEKRMLLKAIIPTSSLFIAGCLFSYFIVLPMAVDWMYMISSRLGAVTRITLSVMLRFSLITILISGFAFQLPVVMFLLSKIGFVGAETWDGEKLTILGVLFVLIMLAPGGIIESGIIFAPVFFLYFLGMLVSKKICGR